MRIGILGGTGIEGKGLALRFGLAGVPITIGSRSAERAAALAAELNTLLGSQSIRGATNTEMLAESGIVFLAVPFAQAVAAIEQYAGHLAPGGVLVDVTVPMRFAEGRPEYIEQEAGSGAELIAATIPAGSRIVAAFKEIPAHVLAEIGTPLDCDLLVCGDSAGAKEQVMALAGRIPALRPLDAGPLSMARILERMTVLAVHLNRRYKRKGARFKIQGI